MDGGRSIGLPALILMWLLLAPPAEADYRFDDGVWLGPGELLPDWADTLARMRAQQPALDACLADRSTCEARLRGLPLLLERARTLSRERQIRLINRYVNKRRYRGDRTERVHSTVADGPVLLRSRWATLVEFLRRGGDCEDYATSKYQLLRLLGLGDDELRVVVAYDRMSREHHALLAVRMADSATWLLDSDNSIHRRRPFGYRYVYALNASAIWDHEMTPRSRPAPQPLEEAS